MSSKSPYLAEWEQPASDGEADSSPAAGTALPLRQFETRSATGEQATRQLNGLVSLVDQLSDAGVYASEAELESGARSNALIQVRLGLASSLFACLRAKHGPTAAHSLRVALGCSSWGRLANLPDAERDALEVAALLHDVGKIGVPDEILAKAGKLSDDQVSLVERHHRTGLEILRNCCAGQDVLEIVEYASAWFNGRRAGFDRSGEALPLGARMLAIVDAFDAMTSNQVYRRAMSGERAVAELFEHAGTQFDVALVRSFAKLLEQNLLQLSEQAASRWLTCLRPQDANLMWQLKQQVPADEELDVQSLFHRQLLEHLQDGVAFVDSSQKILLWNAAVEGLTGIAADSIRGQRWSPQLLELTSLNRRELDERSCPVRQVLLTRTQLTQRVTATVRGGTRLTLELRCIPVISRGGVAHGVAVLLRDDSSQADLEEAVQSLQERATRDPLTQVANRAEFDSAHVRFVERCLQDGQPFSLIICDVDRFKSINDTYGHQAGDEALVEFAALLRRSCRSGDLVARYGGEEFVVLCQDCDNATATRRADAIRVELSQIPLAALQGRAMTASFGVTEFQPGDTPETMLRRADRALMTAKDTGRNRVVQLGSGSDVQPEEGRSWFAWFQSPADKLLEQQLITAVPLNVATEKLRGFIADHSAQVLKVEEDRISMRLDGQTLLRRAGDRPVSFVVDLSFREVNVDVTGRADGSQRRTLIVVVIRPRRNRDRRREDALERVRTLLVSLKSYFVAQEFTGELEAGGDGRS